MRRSFLLLFFATVFTVCASEGKIVVVGDIHEFLEEEDVKEMIHAAGNGGLLVIPGDFLHHPYHSAALNPKGMPINNPNLLQAYDEKIVGWFKKYKSDDLAGIAIILGNHDFSRGRQEAERILKKLSSKVQILDERSHDFKVNGYIIRVIGYASSWRYDKGTGKEAQTGKKPITMKAKIQKQIDANVDSKLSSFKKPYGIILMTHEGGSKHDRDADDLALANALNAKNMVIVGGHTHNIITFSKTKNGKYKLYRQVIRLNHKQIPHYDNVSTWQEHMSIPILKTGWHNQHHYSVWFPKGNSVSLTEIPKHK